MTFTYEVLANTAAGWSGATVLKFHQEGLETDTGKRKLGDGTTIWSSLPYTPMSLVRSMLTATVSSVPNTTGPTTLWTPTPIPLANIAAHVTKARIVLGGKADAITTSGTFTVKILVNGVNIGAFVVVASQTGTVTGKAWDLVADLYVDTLGATGTVSLSGASRNLAAGGTTWTTTPIVAEAVVVDLTTGFAPSVNFLMGTANAANIIYFVRGEFAQQS